MKDAATTEPQADLREQLPNAVYRTIIADLYAFVPSPQLTDPDLIADRVHAAIAEIATMVPVNADEAQTALRVVIANAHAKECFRQARSLFNDPAAAMKCEAMANNLQRTANAARALLLRVQAARRKREAVQQACAQDAWTIHATEGYLLKAAGHPTAVLPQPVNRPVTEPASPSSAPAAPDDDKFARYDVAEQYAALYPRRAAEIRAHGGIPPTATWGRPDQETVTALLTSNSPLIQQIDQEHARKVRA